MKGLLQLELSDPEEVAVEVWISAKFLNQKNEERVPITSRCLSYRDLEEEVGNLKRELDLFLDQAKKEFEKKESNKIDFDPGESVENIWRILNMVEEEEELFTRFNALKGETREKIAHYVFATQNAFKGKALIFSTHYNEETHFLE